MSVDDSDDSDDEYVHSSHDDVDSWFYSIQRVSWMDNTDSDEEDEKMVVVDEDDDEDEDVAVVADAVLLLKWVVWCDATS